MGLNVLANTFTPATEESAKAALVRCAHGYEPTSAISSQIVVCNEPEAFKNFKANVAWKYVSTTSTTPKKTSKMPTTPSNEPPKNAKIHAKGRVVIIMPTRKHIRVRSWRQSMAATALTVTAKLTRNCVAMRTSAKKRHVTNGCKKGSNLVRNWRMI